MKHSNAVFALAFDPSQQILAAADGDSDVILYDVESRYQVGWLRGRYASDPARPAAIDALAFSPDGGTLYTAGRRNPIVAWSGQLWARDHATMQRLACDLVGDRNLTPDEARDVFRGTRLADSPPATCDGEHDEHP